jgi:hypothetical protein
MVTAKRRSAGEAITPTISWFASLTGLRVIMYLAIPKTSHPGRDHWSGGKIVPRRNVLYIDRDRIRAGGVRLIIRRVARKHPLDVFGQNVEFNVDQGADLDVVDVGVLLGVGNDPDGEALP